MRPSLTPEISALGPPAFKKSILDSVETLPEEVVNAAVERALKGKSPLPRTKKSIHPLTKHDEDRLSKLIGMNVEQFNQAFAAKLADLSDKIHARMVEKLDNDQFKPGELAFALSVSEDKRRALDARAQLGSAQVNIQVNNYGEKSREEIMADLLLPTMPALPAEETLRAEDVI
jgi:hypothetical protein